MASAYKSGVFSCMDDMGTCLLGTCVPCYLAANVIGADGRQIGQGVNSLWCILGTCCACVPCAAWVARSKVQDAYNIKEDILTRCVLWWYARTRARLVRARALTRAGPRAPRARCVGRLYVGQAASVARRPPPRPSPPHSAPHPPPP